MPLWKSLLLISDGPPGAKAPIDLYCVELTQLSVSISAKYLTPFSSTGICAPVSPLSLIFNIFPSSPLAFTVAPSCLNCHWGPLSSTCSSPEVSPVVPSSSESVGRLANSSVPQSVLERSSMSMALFTTSFFVVGASRVGAFPCPSDSETLLIFWAESSSLLLVGVLSLQLSQLAGAPWGSGLLPLEFLLFLVVFPFSA